MKQSIIKAVISNVEINQFGLEQLINNLPKEQQENAIELLLGVHPYMRNELPKTKKVENKKDKVYTKPLELISYNLLTNLVEYREDYLSYPLKWYKTQEDADNNSDDRSNYQTRIYTVSDIIEEDVTEQRDIKFMSIEGWLNK